MSFLSEDNKEVNQPMELSMFASAPNQVAIDKINYTEERPISNLLNDSTLFEIVVSGAGSDYIDLRKSRLYVKRQILKVDGSALSTKEKNSYRQFTFAKYQCWGLVKNGNQVKKKIPWCSLTDIGYFRKGTFPLSSALTSCHDITDTPSLSLTISEFLVLYSGLLIVTL
jgi:hypothetical protein